jgi:hypothetical protein
MPSSETPSASRSVYVRFNVYLVVLGAFTLFVNWMLPHALQYVRPCARYIETDLPALATAFVAIGSAANLLHFLFTWLFARSRTMRTRRHALVFWGLLACVGWLMLNGFLVGVLPTLLNNPELLCD